MKHLLLKFEYIVMHQQALSTNGLRERSIFFIIGTPSKFSWCHLRRDEEKINQENGFRGNSKVSESKIRMRRHKYHLKTDFYCTTTQIFNNHRAHFTFIFIWKRKLNFFLGLTDHGLGWVVEGPIFWTVVRIEVHSLRCIWIMCMDVFTVCYLLEIMK